MEISSAHPELSQSRIEVAPGVYVQRAELRFHFARSGGPGGQNVNKVNTKAEMRVSLNAFQGLRPGALARLIGVAANKITSEGDLLIVSDSERSQEANRGECMARLRALLVGVIPEPKVRRKTRPSRSSKERRLQSKRAHSEKKQQRRGDF